MSSRTCTTDEAATIIAGEIRNISSGDPETMIELVQKIKERIDKVVNNA